MTTIREFRCIDLLRFASVNLDDSVYTANARVAPCNRIIGYIIGEAHSATRVTKEGTYWSAHVTAVTVASGYRRQKSGTTLLQAFEENHNNSHRAYYTNLFVRESNIVAIKMFTKLGYINFRCIRGFYSDNEDALEFRKFYSQVSDRDDYGNVRLGVYKAVDDLNYYANPLFTWGDGRKAEGIGRQRFHAVDNREFLRLYHPSLFYGNDS